MPAFAGMPGERNKKAGSNPGLFSFSSLRAKRSNPAFRLLCPSSAARSRDPLARNDAWVSLLRRLHGFAQRRIIRIALGAAAVECRLVRRIQWGAALEALDQIGVGDEQLSECDQVGLIGGEH